ncbi:hypothetical protein BC835DRAFT_1410046 [Cytidiella melzeri]|nr:hypothetical protein BC835DRAFT_1410046 [Cytidiella melzeri]
MSQDPKVNSHETLRSQEMSTLAIKDAASSDADIDAYMAEQGETSGEATVVHDVDPPSITLNGSVATAQPTPRKSQLSPAQRLETIVRLCNKPLEVGDTWYLVARQWFRRWEKACSGEEDKDGAVEEKDLGPVDNTPLVDQRGNLISSTIEHVDVEFVPYEAWLLFGRWYGAPLWPLPRKVIPRGIMQEATIELHPPRFFTHILLKSKSDELLRADETTRNITMSSNDSVANLRKAIIAAHIPNHNAQNFDQYRIWKLDDLHEGGMMNITVDDLVRIGATLVEDSDSDIDHSLIDNGDSFVLESKLGEDWLVDASRVPGKSGDASFSQLTQVTNAPLPLFSSGTDFFAQLQKKSDTTSSLSNSTTLVPTQSSLKPSSFIKSTVTKDPRQLKINKPLPGTLGLGNMGNTCFMNSAIQCLAHTKELVDYFLTGVFEEELNPDNPLGMGGAIAEAFGQLLKKIWSPTTSSTSYSPREFKQVLQKFAPQFSGYQQHDSQELVAFLLDGLHEDLNRVLKKPYVEKPDWEGGDQKELVELAQKSWDGYMKRNDSVIVDLFQGQYQSTLVCPECQKVSITFDPFMYLTLPLPVQKKWKHKVYYIPWDLDKPHLEIAVEIGSQSTFKDVRSLLGRWMSANPDHLLTMEIFSSRFYKNLDDNVMCTEMSDSDVIVCYELPCNSQQSRSYKKQEGDPFILPVILSDSRPIQRYGNANSQQFGYPFFIFVTPEQATNLDSVYDLVVEKLQRWTTNVRDLHSWQPRRASSPMEEVPIPLMSGTGTETVTEFKENGEVVTVQEPVPEEGDIADEKSIEAEEQEVGSEEITPRRLGYKKDLFHLRVQPGNTQYGVGYGNVSSSRVESWDQRMERLHEEGSQVLLNECDTITCEFDENVKAYYFGDKPEYELARWTTWEPFIHPELSASREAASQQKKRGITLQDCLDEFTKEEQLGEDDLWYCPSCKKHQQATKRFDLWSVPDVLVVHLKRFSNNRSLRDKIDTLVEFPLEGLDLTPMVGKWKAAKEMKERGEDIQSLGLTNVEEPLIYDLYAVDEHMGGLGGGHYRAYAHNDTDEKWYHFDDSYVSVSQASSSVTSNAYLLFYRRRTSRPLGGTSFKKVQAAKVQAQSSQVESADPAMDMDSSPVTQLPTPPVDIPDKFSSDGVTDPWRLAHFAVDSTNAQSSPASSLPPFDDAEPPPFDEALNDLVLQPGSPLLVGGITFDEDDDSASNGSPSSIQAEIDLEDVNSETSDDSIRRSPIKTEQNLHPFVPTVDGFEFPDMLPGRPVINDLSWYKDRQQFGVSRDAVNGDSGEELVVMSSGAEEGEPERTEEDWVSVPEDGDKDKVLSDVDI